jgi:hypothetical protein
MASIKQSVMVESKDKSRTANLQVLYLCRLRGGSRAKPPKTCHIASQEAPAESQPQGSWCDHKLVMEEARSQKTASDREVVGR